MIIDQSEEDFNPFRWAAHFNFVSPGSVLHGTTLYLICVDCIKQHILEDVDLAFGPDFGNDFLPAIQRLPSELLELINAVDISFIHNKKDAENPHDRMTTSKLRETAIDFAGTSSPSTAKRIVLKLKTSTSSPHPKSPCLLANEVLIENTFGIQDQLDTQENIESIESFFCELSIKNDPWTLSECQDAMSSIHSLITRIKTSNWLPQQVNIETFLKKAVENLDSADEQVRSTIFNLAERLVGSGIALTESLVITTFSAILAYIRSKKSFSCLKCIVEMFYALENQLISEFWRVVAAIIGSTESTTAKNALADCFSQVLLHILHVHSLHQPENITEFTEKLTDELIEFILEKKNLEIVAKFSQHAFQLGSEAHVYPYLGAFIERFQKLLLAVLTGKLDVTSKNFAMDRLGDIVSSYACNDQLVLADQSKKIAVLNDTSKIASVLLKLIGEDSAIIRLKSVRRLYSISEFPIANLNIKSSIPAILIRCLQDSSVMLKEASLDLLAEYITKHGLSNTELIDSLEPNSLLRSKVLPILQYLLAQNVPRKNEIIVRLLESVEHIQFLKENWIESIIHNEDFMQQLVEAFALVPQPYCLLEFIKTIEQDPLIGRQFSKASENIVDSLIEKLIDENSPKADSAINNLMQSLLVFCYGRYEVLSPHLSVLCYYAFDAKFANTAMTSCHLLSLLVEGSSSLDLKQQPRIVEKLAKAIVQSSEQMLSHLLRCLSVFEREISKLTEKFKNYLLRSTDLSASATCRSLLVLGHCAKYYSSQDDVLKVVTEFIYSAEPQIQAYAQMAFCLFIPQTLNFKPIDSQILRTCLENDNIRVRKQALKSIIEALESLELDKKEQSPVNFDPKAFNSVRSQMSNTQGMINEVLDKILEIKNKDDEQLQVLIVKIMSLLLKGGFLNPSLIIPSIIGYGLGTYLRDARELFIDAYERYSSLVTGAYQKGLQLAFKICGNADLLVAEELLNYVMHTKNRWKDIRYCVMSIFGKSKDLEYCRWLLSNLQAAGIASVQECEMALKLSEHYVLPLAEIYYEELENGTDPVIINKLSFLLQFQRALKNSNSITESMGRRKGSVHRLPGNMIQVLEECQLHQFIESQYISLNDGTERQTLNMKSTRKRKRKTRESEENEADPINKNYQM